VVGLDNLPEGLFFHPPRPPAEDFLKQKLAKEAKVPPLSSA
jgi:hypothetical protein